MDDLSFASCALKLCELIVLTGFACCLWGAL